MADAETRSELFDLVARYAIAVDRRDASALAALFTRDATMVVPPALGGTGIEESVGDPGRLVRPLERFARTRHTLAQQVIDVEGDRASGTTYAEAHHLYEKDGELRDFAVALQYLDEFVRIEGRWRFVRRELVLDWTQRLTLSGPMPTR